jgi:hypothetical protein
VTGLQFTRAHLILFSLLCLHQSLSGNGFQLRTSPLLWPPELSPFLRYSISRLTDCLIAKLLLAFASTVVLGSVSHGTNELILLPDGAGRLRLLLSAELTVSKPAVLITSRHGPRTKHRFSLLLYSIVVGQLLHSYKHASLRSKHLVTAVVHLFCGRYLGTAIYATIFNVKGPKVT